MLSLTAMHGIEQCRPVCCVGGQASVLSVLMGQACKWLKEFSGGAADLMTWGVKRSVFAALPYSVQARFLHLPAAVQTGICFVHVFQCFAQC